MKNNIDTEVAGAESTQTTVKRGRGRPRKEETSVISLKEPKKKRFVLPELPVLPEAKKGKTEKLTVEFPMERTYLSETVFREDEEQHDVLVFHLFPKLSDWPARSLPDAPNPRSHGKEALRSPVAKGIEETLRNRTADFHYINRGLTIMADSLEYNKKTKNIEIAITDPENHGIADGATTDAVLSKIQTEVKQEIEANPDMINYLERGRIRIEAIVGLKDHERISWIVEGRNTSRQVKGWSLAEFRGYFDWLKEILDAEDSPFKNKVGWEENSPQPISVLDILSLITLFHREWDMPSVDGKVKAPTIAYASKGKLDQRMLAPELEPGYKALTPIVKDVLKLHDFIYAGFEKQYDVAFKGKTKLGRRVGFESRLQGKPYRLPLTDAESNYVIQSGIIYPLLASFRALIRYDKNGQASWKRNVFRFFDQYGSQLIASLIGQLEESGESPNAFGKNKLNYISLEREARLILSGEASEKETKEELIQTE